MMDIQKEISNLKKRVKLLERKVDKSGSAPKYRNSAKKEQSIKEFMLSKKPKDDTQKTLVIGGYLEKYKNLTSFNLKDIENGFQDAKEKAPGNINDRINALIRQGSMMKAKEKKDNKVAWTLTNSGEGVLDEGFQNKK